MDRVEAEKILQDYGFVGEKVDDDFKDNCILYRYKEHDASCLDIFINHMDLYADEHNFVQFEVDDYGLVTRLYYEYHYIGCVVEDWEDLEIFKLEHDFTSIGGKKI